MRDVGNENTRGTGDVHSVDARRYLRNDASGAQQPLRCLQKNQLHYIGLEQLQNFYTEILSAVA